MNELIVNSDVKKALRAGEPVVALESTVITHGLPYPQNVETALAMETAVRQGGATPATIAIIQGQIHVGLTHDQIEHLGQQAGKGVIKCSRRNISFAVAQKRDGATTVAGTMILAHMANIPIFATGGIGGVHRGHPFDVSADLEELGRTPVAVVSSGAKSILDLPATREVLETKGVLLVGYGTNDMPSFFSRSSGLTVDVQLDSPEETAAIIHTHRQLRLQSGILVAVPVPIHAACEPEMIEVAISQANQEVIQQGIDGPEATPWLLNRLVTLTDGKSLEANRALLLNNGFTAAQIASAFAKIT